MLCRTFEGVFGGCLRSSAIFGTVEDAEELEGLKQHAFFAGHEALFKSPRRDVLEVFLWAIRGINSVKMMLLGPQTIAIMMEILTNISGLI